MHVLVHVWCILCACTALVACLRDGPPESACVDMRPGTRVGVDGLDGHTSLPINLIPYSRFTLPFYIHIDIERNFYIQGEAMKVHIMANQTDGSNRYKGVLMQARQLHCASNQTVPQYAEVGDTPMGRFQLPSSSGATLLKTMDCLDRPASAVCHRSPQFKIDEEVTWHVPADMSGNVIFRATFVDNVNKYWTEVNSRVLRDTPGGPVTICGAPYQFISISLLLTALCAAWVQSQQ